MVAAALASRTPGAKSVSPIGALWVMFSAMAAKVTAP